MSHNTQLPELGDTTLDKITPLLKGIVGMIPYAGSLFAEILTVVIPNRRIERIEQYLKILDRKISELDCQEDELRERLTHPEFQDVFEESVLNCVRALTIERQDYIAQIVVNGLRLETTRLLNQKKMLRLLESLDDIEVLILIHYFYSDFLVGRQVAPEIKKYFYEKNEVLIEEPRLYISSSREDQKKHSIFQSRVIQLTSLGLIKEEMKIEAKGMKMNGDGFELKSKGQEITPLGVMLVNNILGYEFEAD